MGKTSILKNKNLLSILFLILLTGILYYKFFIFGLIPFPGDALVGSYSPWFDYFKIPVQNPLITDVFSQFFLWKYLGIEQFQNLQWPLWNPYSFTGTPLLATYHSAVLYPLNILLFLPKNFGWGLFIHSQTLLGSLTFYLFASLFVKSKLARITGSIIFSLSGLMTTWLELGTAVHAMAWIPFSLYSLIKLIELLRVRYLIALIFSLVMIVLAGNPQLTTYGFILIFIFSIWTIYKNKFSLTRIFLPFAALSFAIIITSVQLLPSFDLLQKSIRQTDGYIKEHDFGLLDAKDSIRFFIADYFGNPVTRNYWGTLNYAETSLFLGTLILPLLIYAISKIRDRDFYFFLSLAGVTLLLSFKNLLALVLYETQIPLFTSSYASRMLFLLPLSIAAISSITIEHILSNNTLKLFYKHLIWAWSAILGIILGTSILFFWVKNIITYPITKEASKAYSSSGLLVPGDFIIAIRNSFIPFILISILLCLLFIVIKSRFIKAELKPKIAICILMFFIFFDLGRYFLKFNPFVSQELIFPQTPALEFLQKKPGIFRIGREHAEVFPPNTWIAYKLSSFEGYDPLYLSNYGKFMNYLNTGNFEEAGLTRYAELHATYSSPFLDTANIKYFVGILRDKNGLIPGDELYYKFKETDYPLIYKDRSLAILENPHALERVYFAKSLIYLPVLEAAKYMKTNPSFDPRKQTVLSNNLNINNVDGEGSLKIIEYSPNRVTIESTSSTNQVAILADQFDEGWVATIDGKQTKIVRANLIFRAVNVPSGSHTITFYYYPQSFGIGLKISIIGIVCLIIITIVAKTKKIL